MDFLGRFNKNYLRIPSDLKDSFEQELLKQNTGLFRLILGIFSIWLLFLLIIDIQGINGAESEKFTNFIYPDAGMLTICFISFIAFFSVSKNKKYTHKKQNAIITTLIIIFTFWSAYINFLEDSLGNVAYTLPLTYLIIILLHSGPPNKYLLFTIPSLILYLSLSFFSSGIGIYEIQTKMPLISMVVFGMPLYVFIYSTRVRNFLFRKKIFGAYRNLRRENSKRIKIEKELRNSKVELQTLLEKEKELNNLKVDFINMISHQYRTPLTIIMSSSYLLDMKTRELKDPKVSRHIEKIQTSVNQMLKLLENVIIIGKTDNPANNDGEVTFDLISFIRKISNEINEEYDNKNSFSFIPESAGIYIKCSIWYLNNILTNIISNSVKFSPESSEIIIAVSQYPEKVEISVSDNGIGIPEDFSDTSVFSEFSRGSNVGTIPGFGLGMSIAKKSADKINAEIIINSRKKIGTEIIISIPQQ